VPAACDLPCAALAAPPPVAMPAIIVITPTAMAILVVQRIRISRPLRSSVLSPRPGFPQNPSTRDISQEPDENPGGAPNGT
jgi:hypothetical protein